MLHRLVKHKKGHKDPWKNYIFQEFPVEIKRWICSYVTTEVPTGLRKQTHLLSSLYIHAKSQSISYHKEKNIITRDFEEKQSGELVSRAVEFSGIKLQFRGRHHRGRLLLDASRTSPQADLRAADTQLRKMKNDFCERLPAIILSARHCWRLSLSIHQLT